MPGLRGQQVRGLPVTTQPPPYDRQTASSDVGSLHSRQVARLVAYLSSSDRRAGAREAESVAGEAFREVASVWPRIGNFSSPEVYLFACAHRIAVTRSQLGRARQEDALAESMPAFGDQADLARLAVLQDALDQLPAAPRYAVLLREMCGFSPVQSAEIIGLPETTVELARDDALRALVPVVESGTAAVQARRGPLSPDDFAALNRVLQHPDADRLAERRRLAARLFGQGLPPGTGPLPTGGVPLSRSTTSPGWNGSARSGFGASSREPLTGDFYLEPGWSRMTPLDAPLSTVDLLSTSTPIFDAISAWFSSDARERGSDNWEALDDRGWREANARAAAVPEVAGLSEAGLPKRRPGANRVPSAAEVGPGTRRMFEGRQRPDPGQVRHKLDSFQQGVNTARRLRGRLGGSEDGAEASPVSEPETERPWDPLFDPMPARRAGDNPRVPPAAQPSRSTRPSAPEQARVATGSAQQAGAGRDESAFRTFQREYLPQLLAALLLEGAQPVVAAELVQEVFDEAKWNWSTLQSPQKWVWERALALLAHRRLRG
jgi:DNA-directed RNA polymerase specialized sigma24 family protein